MDGVTPITLETRDALSRIIVLEKKRSSKQFLGGTMRFRVVLLLATIVSLIAGAPARAQWNDFKKWEITPFVGFETAGSYPITSSFTVDRLRADSGASFGAFVDYSLTENA